MKLRGESRPGTYGMLQLVRATCQLLRRLGMTLLALTLAISQVAWSVAQAQNLSEDIDFDPPVIDHESLDTGTAGELQVFSALVVDDRGLERVTLFYRSTTGQDYREVPMQQLTGTDNFTASVDTELDQQKIDYYIEALDTGGNRVLKGFPFFPLVRALDPPVAAPVVAEPAAPAAEPKGSGRSVLYIVLGALAVGLLAGLAGSGDSGGGGSNGGGENPDNTVPLTINVSPP